MAHIVLNPIIKNISGKVGGFVFYAYNNTQYMRRYVVPKNPDTGAQRIRRTRFAEAVSAWQGLSESARDCWNRKSRCVQMSGYNLFISSYLSGELTDLSDRSTTHSARFSSRFLRSLSVIDSYMPRNRDIDHLEICLSGFSP